MATLALPEAHQLLLLLSKDISDGEDSNIEPTVAKKQCHSLTSTRTNQASTSSKKRC